MTDRPIGETDATVTRFSPGGIVDGDYVDAVESTFPFRGSFQWVVGQNVVMSEDRTRTRTELYCAAHPDQTKLRVTKLESGAKTRADLVDWMGTTYKVTQARDWTWDTDGFPHMSYKLSELGLDETG